MTKRRKKPSAIGQIFAPRPRSPIPQLKAKIGRTHDGFWVGIGAIPVGNGQFTIMEIVDERPIVDEVARYYGHNFGDAGVDDTTRMDDMYRRQWLVGAVQNQARDAVRYYARDRLIKKMGRSVRVAYEALELSPSVLPTIDALNGQLENNGLEHHAALLIQGLIAKDPEAFATMAGIVRRLNAGDQKAQAEIQAIRGAAAAFRSGQAM